MKEGKCVRGINAEGCADMTRKQIDSLVEFVKTYRAKGLAYVTYTADGGVKSSFNKFLTPEFAEKLRERFGAKPGDILFFVADKDAVAFQSLGALRIEIARRRGLIPEGVYDLFWVTEFPLFEYSEEEGRYVAMHHPFTSWMPEDEAYLENEKDKVRARAYDLVMNGIEMGSGSIRIHRSDMQAKMFKMIGLSDEEAQHRFGFLTDAFKYGTPPHGGFAFGLDRLTMILTGSDSLRDVVAFPKAQGANCLMMETPADVRPGSAGDAEDRRSICPKAAPNKRCPTALKNQRSARERVISLGRSSFDERANAFEAFTWSLQDCSSVTTSSSTTTT